MIIAQETEGRKEFEGCDGGGTKESEKVLIPWPPSCRRPPVTDLGRAKGISLRILPREQNAE